MPRKAYRGFSTGETITVNAADAGADLSTAWWPAIMYGNSSFDFIDDWENNVPGKWGGIRMVQGFSTTNYDAASSAGDYVTRFNAYLNQSEMRVAVANGPVFITVHGPPTDVASATAMYAVKVPADNSAGGSWQQRCVLMMQTAASNLGSLYKNPRVGGTGAVDFRLPGLVWELGNEWGGSTAQMLSDAKTTYQRFWNGCKSVDPNCVIMPANPIRQDVTEASGKRFIREMCEFAGANSCPPDVIGWHTFQGEIAYGGTGVTGQQSGEDFIPFEHVVLGRDNITSSLAAGGLSAATARACTEYQSNTPFTLGVDSRENYHSAAYVHSTIWEHCYVGGMSSMMMASLIKQGTPPPDSNPFQETAYPDGWGVITRGSVHIPTANFTMLKLFSFLSESQQCGFGRRGNSQLRYVTAKKGNELYVCYSRWKPRAAAINLRVIATNGPAGKTLVESRHYQIDATHNNVQQVFASTVGSDTVKANAARAAGLSPTYSVGGADLSFSANDVCSGLIQFIYA